MPQAAEKIDLKPETLQAWTDYIRDAEAGMELSLTGASPFLWADAVPERAAQVRAGKTLAQLWPEQRLVRVPEGLIHDWVGATYAAGATVAGTVALAQNYDNHKNIYKPECIDSKLISRDGDDFKMFMRLLKKKVITVVLDTDHDVHYAALDPERWYCRSYTTRISEVDNAGKPNEQVHPPDTGYGFLWRLYSYWRFQERDGGTWIECRAISLTRDVPKGLGWIIEPIITKLPGESLAATLESMRRAL